MMEREWRGVGVTDLLGGVVGTVLDGYGSKADIGRQGGATFVRKMGYVPVWLWVFVMEF